ncbi:dicarboxylate/amino acid:cation symporter [Singulisphaera sp. PoT]|uniref:dicarboxylate/amino acid:cation symporter n=1 Tax=Singulisphaera sp. PoT TaxID=3411797 RepID=UPI003BF4625C
MARILLAMVLGAVIGMFLGERATPLGDLGKLLIDLIKGLAGPLLFLAVLDGFLHTHVKLRGGLIMVGIAMTNAVLAIVLGLLLSNVLQPGHYLSTPAKSDARTSASAGLAAARSIDFSKALTDSIPTGVVKPFLDNTIISIVVLAVMIGIALRLVKNEQLARGDSAFRAIEDGIATLYRTFGLLLSGVIKFVPLAVFGVVAKTIGHEGFGPIRGLAPYVLVTVFGLGLQVFLVYQGWLILVARYPLKRFWAGAKDAVVYAMGASSSLASLPVTLRCLERMKVSDRSARLAACVGTNLNNDGILLYEAMAVLAVAQAYGIKLTLGQQFLTAFCCLLAGIGIGGIPDAGLISLALVLATVGLPTEIVPILMTVDWLLSRCRAMTNVTSDILVAVLLDRFDPPEKTSDEESIDPEYAAGVASV